MHSGKITDIKVTPASAASDSTLSATVTFERDSAAKTALLLDNTQLGDLPVKVESTASLDEITERSTTAHEADEDEIRQEDKPRTTVLAEYLSHGYVIGDNVLQKGTYLETGVMVRYRGFKKSNDIILILFSTRSRR